jgi:hypothetical protein
VKNKKAQWLAQTAVFIALLIGGQAATASFGQLVTGSWVNFILIMSVMMCGLASGFSVALISPVMAKLLGIGPLWTIIPFMAAGNAALALVWHTIGKMKFANTHIARVAALVIAAAGKFMLLYIGIVRLAIPLLLNLPENQAAVISGIFSVPQLFTASIGGALALLILPVIEKVAKKSV